MLSRDYLMDQYSHEAIRENILSLPTLTLKGYTSFVFRDQLALGVSPGQAITASGYALFFCCGTRDLSGTENCVSCELSSVRTFHVFSQYVHQVHLIKRNS